MILKWVQSKSRAGEAQAVKQGDDEERKVNKNSSLIDVAHEAMNEKAAEDSATLEALIRMGWPHVKRERFKGKVRKKVWDIVGSQKGLGDTDIVDEITERIVDAAEADPYYIEMFDKDD